MNEFESIELVANEIKRKLNLEKNVMLLYAFNSTGKTRISTLIQNSEDDENVLCFNAFIEDLFTWDNNELVFKIEKNWIVDFIVEQDIEGEIIDNFKSIIDSKLEPKFNLTKGQVIFKMATGDNNYDENIKISRAEESIFKWSIFYTILFTAIECLSESKDERLSNKFDNLKYIIIDDPVSSIDDCKIIALGIQIYNLINNYKGETDLKFIITTHHSLFYNVLYNSFGKNRKYIFNTLRKKDKKYIIEYQNDSPFGYHLIVKKEIDRAISEDDVKKYHFNLFRCLLEKTSYFLGYHKWENCIINENNATTQEIIRLINLYSHDTLSELDSKELNEFEKELFIKTYSNFVKEFKWGQNDG